MQREWVKLQLLFWKFSIKQVRDMAQVQSLVLDCGSFPHIQSIDMNMISGGHQCYLWATYNSRCMGGTGAESRCLKVQLYIFNFVFVSFKQSLEVMITYTTCLSQLRLLSQVISTGWFRQQKWIFWYSRGLKV